jgi:lipopolysaccharide export LptBFGC system permease protein LptF
LLVAAMAGIAFALALRAPRDRLLIPSAITVALLAAHTVMTVADSSKHPGSHRRWPMELAVALVWSVPAWAGAALARLPQSRE